MKLDVGTIGFVVLNLLMIAGLTVSSAFAAGKSISPAQSATRCAAPSTPWQATLPRALAHAFPKARSTRS